jgi:hypothetical protein
MNIDDDDDDFQVSNFSINTISPQLPSMSWENVFGLKPLGH